MLPYKSFISFNLGPLTIQSWGLMVAIGFLIAIAMAVHEAKKQKIKPENIYNIAFIAIITGIIGARLGFVLQEWGYYSNNLIDIFKIWKGGMGFLSGFLIALLFVYLYIKRNNWNFWKYVDIVTPAIVIGQAFGRIGCILGDGGHVGRLTNMPWGFLVNNEVRHVTAWYSLIGLIMVYFILFAIKSKKYKQGTVFLSYLMLYSVMRFIVDIFRIDPRYFGLTAMQTIAIPVFLIAGYIVLKKYRKHKP